MDEQGVPQVTNAELIADLEAILLELGNRLNNYLDLGADDLAAADEGFNFAGQMRRTSVRRERYRVNALGSADSD